MAPASRGRAGLSRILQTGGRACAKTRGRSWILTRKADWQSDVDVPLQNPYSFAAALKFGLYFVAILLLVEGHLCRSMLERIAEVGHFDVTPGTGIAFQVDIEDADDTDITGRVGALFSLGEQTRLGVVYQSETKLNMEGNTTVNPIGLDFNAALKLIEQEEVVAIIGPNSSKQAVPAGDVANNYETPMITPWSTNPDSTKDRPFVFRGCFLDPFQGPVLANFITEEFGFTKAAVLYDVASDYPKGLAEFFSSAWEDVHGDGSVVAYESFTTKDTDFSSQLTKIKQSGAEVLFTPQYYNEVALIVQQARQLGFDHLVDAVKGNQGQNRTEDLGLKDGVVFRDVDDDRAGTPRPRYLEGRTHRRLESGRVGQRLELIQQSVGGGLHINI